MASIVTQLDICSNLRVVNPVPCLHILAVLTVVHVVDAQAADLSNISEH